jgi:hypothetical protein
MAKVNTDIDIDFADRAAILVKLPHIPAMLQKSDGPAPHNSGVYFQQPIIDPINKLPILDADQAEEHGFFKIDFLNNSLYDGIRDEAHLIDLMTQEPMWELLWNEAVSSKLAHLGKAQAIINKIQPQNIEELAIVISLTRPGKAYLLDASIEEIRENIWKKEEKFYFKKAHAIAYATSIVVQLNFMCEKLLADDR